MPRNSESLQVNGLRVRIWAWEEPLTIPGPHSPLPRSPRSSQSPSSQPRVLTVPVLTASVPTAPGSHSPHSPGSPQSRGPRISIPQSSRSPQTPDPRLPCLRSAAMPASPPRRPLRPLRPQPRPEQRDCTSGLRPCRPVHNSRPAQSGSAVSAAERQSAAHRLQIGSSARCGHGPWALVLRACSEERV